MNQSLVVSAVWTNNIPTDLTFKTTLKNVLGNYSEVENIRENRRAERLDRNWAFILIALFEEITVS